MTENHIEAVRDYWTLRAEGYSQSINDELESGRYKHWLNIILKHLDGKKNLKVLDIGTGPGFFAIIMGREGHSITAVDYTEAMLEQAKTNCMKYGVEADFIRMDAQNLSFEDDSFDLVISRNLVWDLDNPVKAYSEWMRVLKPEGKLMVFDGNHYLYLYDKDYANMRNASGKTEHRFMGNVDGNIMQNIAKELPLSSQRRPQWDVDTLIEMGAKCIHVDTDGRDSYRLEHNGRTIFLPFSFFICVTK